MQKEVDSAVQFICGLLRARSMSLDLVEAFRTVLCEVMYGRYEGHWFPEKPFRGSAYRCMRINDRNIDPLILNAGDRVGLTIAELLHALPNQLTIWVDPKEVAYRIGEDGSIGVLYDANEASDGASEASDDAGSGGSAAVSAKSTPSQSPIPSSTDDELSPPSPRVSTSCRHEMIKHDQLVTQRTSSSCATGSSDAKTTSRGGATTGGRQYLNPVLVASS